MEIVSRLQGYGPLVYGVVVFLLGYVAGELDGWAFIFVAIVVAAGVAYKRRSTRVALGKTSPKGFL